MLTSVAKNNKNSKLNVNSNSTNNKIIATPPSTPKSIPWLPTNAESETLPATPYVDISLFSKLKVKELLEMLNVQDKK